MKTRKEAIAEAKRTLSLMRTKGWKISVWENLGWHYCLENCRAKLTLWPGYNGERKFSCLFTTDLHSRSGDPRWTSSQPFRNPNKAVEHQFRLAANVIKKENTVFDLFKVVMLSEPV